MARLDDVDEIRQLLARYFHAADAGDMAQWLDCFTDDAVFESPLMRMVGREELSAGGPRLRGTSPTRHWVGNVVVDVDGDEATSVSYLLAVGATQPPTLLVSGVFHDRLRRVDGRWRFAERVLTLDGFGLTEGPVG